MSQTYGGVAQLGEHLPCKQGVKGSIPFISTIAAKAAKTKTEETKRKQSGNPKERERRKSEPEQREVRKTESREKSKQKVRGNRNKVGKQSESEAED